MKSQLWHYFHQWYFEWSGDEKARGRNPQNLHHNIVAAPPIPPSAHTRLPGLEQVVLYLSSALTQAQQRQV
jgi:hypothetical protein